MSSMELSFLIWKKRKENVRSRSETSNLVDEIIFFKMEGYVVFSHKGSDVERVGSELCKWIQDATH